MEAHNLCGSEATAGREARPTSLVARSPRGTAANATNPHEGGRPCAVKPCWGWPRRVAGSVPAMALVNGQPPSSRASSLSPHVSDVERFATRCLVPTAEVLGAAESPGPVEDFRDRRLVHQVLGFTSTIA